MRIHVRADITVTDPTPEVIRECRKLDLPNPEYVTKVRLGKWLGDTPEFIRLFKRFPDKIVLPFGCFDWLWHLHPVKDDWNVAFAPHQLKPFPITFKAYDYQIDAISRFAIRRNGILVMPCGTGKTQTAIAMIARLGLPTLWITHTGELLRQSMKRFIDCTEIKRSDIGTITEGKVEIGNVITFATVQSLVGIDLDRHRDQWGMIVVDECHHAIGAPTRVMMFYKVLSALSARYKIGLTATPERADALDGAMYALLGDVFYTAPEEATKARTVPVRVEITHTGVTPPRNAVTHTDGTIDYAKAVSWLVEDEERNEIICREIVSRLEQGFTVLVLSERVAHLETMMNMVEMGETLSGITTAAGKRARETTLERMRDGDLSLLFATYQLAKEGLDIPRLDCVIFATPKKDFATVIQSAGRASRQFPCKEEGVVVDFEDAFAMWQTMALSRRRHYRKSGYATKIIPHA